MKPTFTFSTPSIILLLIFTISSSAIAQNTDWVFHIPGINGPYFLPLQDNHLGRDAQGNIFMTSNVADQAQFGDEVISGTEVVPGSYLTSAYLAKLDPMGEPLWVEVFNGFGIFLIKDMAVDSNGEVYIGGILDGTITLAGTEVTSGPGDGDMLLAKFDTDGNLLWVVVVIDPNDFNLATASHLEIDSEDNVVVMGRGGPTGSFIRSYDGAGNVNWTQTDFTYSNTVYDVVLDANDNICIAGWVGATGNDFLFAGQNLVLQNGGSYIGKLDSEGNYLWSKAYEAPDNYGVYFNLNNIAIDKNDNSIYVGGTFSEDITFEGVNLVRTGLAVSNMVISRFGTNGDLQWAKQSYGELASILFWDMSTNTAGDVFLAFNSYNGSGLAELILGQGGNQQIYDLSGGSSATIAKYNTSGEFEWAKVPQQNAGESEYQAILAIGENKAITSGWFTHTIGIGATTLTAAPLATNRNVILVQCDGELSSVSEFDQELNNSIAIFPNPSTDQFWIELENVKQVDRIQLINGQGQKVKTIDPIEQLISIDMNHLSTGHYFLQFIGKNGMATRKIIKP